MKKKKNNILKNNGSYESNEYKNLITLIVVIASIFLLFYILTVIFTKENHDNIFNNDLNASEIQYDEIIIGSMFDGDGEYYVLMMDKNESYKDIFNSYVTNIKEKAKIYTVDLSSAFNKKYLGDNYSYDKDDFKTKGILLIKINNHEIKEHYESKEDILNKLKELSKSE